MAFKYLPSNSIKELCQVTALFGHFAIKSCCYPTSPSLESRCLCMPHESTEEHNVIYPCGQLQTVGESKQQAVIVDQVAAP